MSFNTSNHVKQNIGKIDRFCSSWRPCGFFFWYTKIDGFSMCLLPVTFNIIGKIDRFRSRWRPADIDFRYTKIDSFTMCLKRVAFRLLNVYDFQYRPAWPAGRPSGPWLIPIEEARFWDADFGCFWPIFDDLLRVSFRASSKTPCYLLLLCFMCRVLRATVHATRSKTTLKTIFFCLGHYAS